MMTTTQLPAPVRPPDSVSQWAPPWPISPSPVPRSRVGAVAARSNARAAVAAAVARAAAVAEWVDGNGHVVPTPLEFAALLTHLGMPRVARSKVGAVVARASARGRVATAVSRAAQTGAEFLQTPQGKRTLTQFQLAALLKRLGTPRVARSRVGAVVARARARADVAAAVMKAAADGDLP